MYLGVAQVDGPPGCGREHLVVMRRMPDDRRLPALIGDRVPVAGPLRGRWTANYEQVRPETVVIDTSEDEPITAADGASGPVRRVLEAVRPHGPDDVWRPVRPYLLRLSRTPCW